MKYIENIVGKKSGDESNINISHILARVSMPNMMDIIFNLGLNAKIVIGLHHF